MGRHVLPTRYMLTFGTPDGVARWEVASAEPNAHVDGTAGLGASSHLGLAEIDRVVVTSVDRADEILTAR